MDSERAVTLWQAEQASCAADQDIAEGIPIHGRDAEDVAHRNEDSTVRLAVVVGEAQHATGL